MRLKDRENAAATALLLRQETPERIDTMLPYTANDLVSTMKREYGLDELSTRSLLRETPDASPKPRRRLTGWVNSLLTVLF